MTRPQVHHVNNHLTTLLLEGSNRLTEGEQALLEFLCTDSIYSIKDDFDQGINSDLWTVRNMVVADSEPSGVLAGNVDDPNLGGDYLVRSRLPNFYPNRRATIQTRAQISGDGNTQAEVGFVHDSFGDEGSPVVITAAAAVTRGARSFGVAVRSPYIDGWSVVSGGRDGTNRSAATTRVSERGWATFMVAVNEQGETRLWVNGQTNNEVARQTDMQVTQGHNLWVHVAHGLLAIDYIQAWQERIPL